MTSDQIKDFLSLISVFEEVFEMEKYVKPDKSHLQKLLNKKHFFAVTAKVENKIIGGLTVYILDQYYAEKPLAYIYDLAVLTSYQRKGIGKKLISFTNEFCKKNGFEEVFVQAEKEDDYAFDFYRSTQPSGELDVAHYFYKLKEEDSKE